MNLKPLLIPVLIAAVVGCEQKVAPKKIEIEPEKPVYVSTYQPLPSQEFVIRNATILTGTGERLDNSSVWVKDGKVQAVGSDLQVPAGVKEYDGKDKWVSPGIIDVHSHLGVYPSPNHEANEDGNEMTAPVTAQVWAEHAVWTQDPGFDLALAGGVTSMQVLPGSANLIGGRGVTLKNIPSITMQGMTFPDAPHGLKMACGENPKRVYGKKGQAPMTRMGNVAGYRAAWIKAKAYKEKWEKYYKAAEKGEEKDKRGKRSKTGNLSGSSTRQYSGTQPLLSCRRNGGND